MKKIAAMLLASLILTASCTVLAEDTPAQEEAPAEQTEQTAEDTAEKPYLDFDIKMDKIPDGYTYEVADEGGNLYATFTKTGDPDALIVYVSVAHSDEFEGFTLNSDLSEDQLENMKSILAVSYNDPTITVMDTDDDGLKIIIISENDSQTDYADMITIWNGYLVDISLQKKTQITDEDMNLANQIVEDMWIVEE